MNLENLKYLVYKSNVTDMNMYQRKLAYKEYESLIKLIESTNCQFEPIKNSTSATKCKHCGREKWEHNPTVEQERCGLGITNFWTCGIFKSNGNKCIGCMNHKTVKGKEVDIRSKLISYTESLRDYIRESHNNLVYDPRESSVFVDIFLNQPNKVNKE